MDFFDWVCACASIYRKCVTENSVSACYNTKGGKVEELLQNGNDLIPWYSSVDFCVVKARGHNCRYL